jgi:NADPH:quinone reductase-like Zn-dependent oxidoreductase
MTYKSVIVPKRGSSEVLKIIENDLRSPSAGEVRVKTLATSVCQDDVAARIGNRPFLPKLPFVPGYAILGLVDAVGEGVTEVSVGERVAALTRTDGYAEYIFLRQGRLVHVPTTLDPAEAVTLILNYVVAYQVLHRSAQVKAGDKVLIIGASGGCGTAFLQLGQLANLKMYGLASRSKHGTLTALGAIPIDYHTQDFVDVIRHAEPAGLDFVFNGMGEDYLERGMAVLRRGGTLVHYGAPQSFARFLLLLAKFLLFALLPNGKFVKGYGVWYLYGTHRADIHPFKSDLLGLFKLLEEGKIKPIVMKKFPILEAAKANALLESGTVIGNIVLVAPEL